MAEEETTPEEPQKPKGPNIIMRHKRVTMFVIFLLILGFGGNYYISSSSKKAPIVTTSILDTLGLDEDKTDENGPVAKVNGEEIPRVDYLNKLKEINSALSRQGFNTGNAKIASQIRQQAIAELVNVKLLHQHAIAEGYSVSEQEIGDEYQVILEDAGSEEVLLLMLQDRDLTTKDLYVDIEELLVVNKYIDANVDLDSVNVTPEEVRTYYDTVSATNPDIPSFDSIEKKLTEQLTEQQQQQLVTDFIQTLRAEAEIEVLI